MDVAILTVGDEVLAGDTEKTNAAWLAGELTDAGATVARVLTLPDDRDAIAAVLREWHETFDAIAGVRDRFDVTVGSYPNTGGRNRLKRTGTDAETVDEAAAWLRSRVEVVDARDGENHD